MNPEKQRARAKQHEETTSDILAELNTAIATGACPWCGTALIYDDEKSMHCPKCYWGFKQW
jgi:rubrerythrin